MQRHPGDQRETGKKKKKEKKKNSHAKRYQQTKTSPSNCPVRAGSNRPPFFHQYQGARYGTETGPRSDFFVFPLPSGEQHHPRPPNHHRGHDRPDPALSAGYSPSGSPVLQARRRPRPVRRLRRPGVGRDVARRRDGHDVAVRRERVGLDDFGGGGGSGGGERGRRAGGLRWVGGGGGAGGAGGGLVGGCGEVVVVIVVVVVWDGGGAGCDGCFCEGEEEESRVSNKALKFRYGDEMVEWWRSAGKLM
ncbi:hypothetical protein VTK26DRAFT_1851 [Humicola hyalothermophila]